MKKSLALTFLIVLLASCRSVNTTHPITNEEQDVNQTITVIAPPQVNSLKANDFIGLVIQNNSEDKIELSYEYGVSVQEVTENQRSDIFSINNAYISPVVLSPKSHKEFSFAYIDFVISITLQEPSVFRFTVMGINQTTGQEVYGYVDLNLNP